MVVAIYRIYIIIITVINWNITLNYYYLIWQKKMTPVALHWPSPDEWWLLAETITCKPDSRYCKGRVVTFDLCSTILHRWEQNHIPPQGIQG
jgi:hypothetical protein